MLFLMHVLNIQAKYMHEKKTWAYKQALRAISLWDIFENFEFKVSNDNGNSNENEILAILFSNNLQIFSFDIKGWFKLLYI